MRAVKRARGTNIFAGEDIFDGGAKDHGQTDVHVNNEGFRGSQKQTDIPRYAVAFWFREAPVDGARPALEERDLYHTHQCEHIIVSSTNPS